MTKAIQQKYPYFLYITFCDFHSLLTDAAPAITDPTPDFAQAVDTLAEQLDEGNHAEVWRINFKTGELKSVNTQALAEAYKLKRL